MTDKMSVRRFRITFRHQNGVTHTEVIRSMTMEGARMAGIIALIRWLSSRGRLVDEDKWGMASIMEIPDVDGVTNP